MGTQAERQKFLNDISNNGDLKQIQQIPLKKLNAIDINKERNNRNQKSNINQRNVNKTEKYTCKNRKLSKREKQIKIMKKRISALLAAGLVAFGSYGAKQYYDNNMKSVTLEEALKAGKTPEEFGLDNYEVEKFTEVRESLKNKDDLSREEILELGKDIESLELSVIKSKIGNEFDGYQEIKVKPRDANGISTITVKKEKGKEIFSDEECLFGDYGAEIGDYIEGIAKIQNTNSQYEKRRIDRDDVFDIYKKSVKNAERFATSEITVNEKGKIKFDKTTKADLEKIKENESKKVASREDEGR